MNYLKDANPGDLLKEIKTKSPLVWNISNFVSMDIAANMLLAVVHHLHAHALEKKLKIFQIFVKPSMVL